jgi:hypothetical protein
MRYLHLWDINYGVPSVGVELPCSSKYLLERDGIWKGLYSRRDSHCQTIWGKWDSPRQWLNESAAKWMQHRDFPRGFHLDINHLYNLSNPNTIKCILLDLKLISQIEISIAPNLQGPK